MQAIILAGGKGRQLRSVDSNVPKPLLPLFDRPLTEHAIRLMAQHGIKDIYITASDAAQEMLNCLGDGSQLGVHIHYSVESEPLGTAGAVKLLQNQINDTLLVFSGDAITDFDISAALEQHKSSGAVASILVTSVDDPADFGMVDMDDCGQLTRILEKPRASEATSNTVSTGIYILEPEALSCIPYYCVCDFSREVFPRMINNSEPIMGIELQGYWCDAGNLQNYRRAHFDALNGKLKLEMPATQVTAGIWVGRDVKIHSSAQLTGPLLLGDGVVVEKNAVIEENTIIGAGTTIGEGSRVRRSIIGCGSSICASSEVVNSLIEGSYTLAQPGTIRDHTLLTQARYTVPRPTSSPIRVPKPRPAQPEPEFSADKVNEQSGSIVR